MTREEYFDLLCQFLVQEIASLQQYKASLHAQYPHLFQHTPTWQNGWNGKPH